LESARFARSSDLDVITQIADLSFTEIEGTRGASVFTRKEVATPARELASATIEDAESVAIVGTYDDVVFGYVLATTSSLSDGEKLGTLNHLVVEPEIRKSGIGEAMMNMVFAELKAMGCSRVDSHALPGDRHTKNFFESFGLKARLLTVHIEL
jgi:predicted N-acetyltransferase YhbS